MSIKYARDAWALQVLAALLHGVQTIHTYDSNKEPNIVGSLDLTVTQVEQATTFFQQALLPLVALSCMASSMDMQQMPRWSQSGWS